MVFSVQNLCRQTLMMNWRMVRPKYRNNAIKCRSQVRAATQLRAAFYLVNSDPNFIKRQLIRAAAIMYRGEFKYYLVLQSSSSFIDSSWSNRDDVSSLLELKKWMISKLYFEVVINNISSQWLTYQLSLLFVLFPYLSMHNSSNLITEKQEWSWLVYNWCILFTI